MTDDIFPLPCPFCGNHPEVVFRRNYYPGQNVWCVVCDCEMLPATNNYMTRSEAVNAWNRRPEPTVQQGELP